MMQIGNKRDQPNTQSTHAARWPEPNTQITHAARWPEPNNNPVVDFNLQIIGKLKTFCPGWDNVNINTFDELILSIKQNLTNQNVGIDENTKVRLIWSGNEVTTLQQFRAAGHSYEPEFYLVLLEH